MADFSLNVKLNGVDQAITTVNELEAALRATREELKNTQIGSQAFEDLSTQAQTLQREFVNSYKETTNFQKGIAELGQSVGSLASTVTAGFTIVTSAFQLFGSETEELSQTQVRAQQALALAISATTIATNAKTIAEDINNVGLALQNGLTKLLTISLGQQTVATAAQAVAAGTATVAQRALNAAMAANPIGLVIAAVTALVGAFFLLGKEEQKTYTYTKDLNVEIDNNTKKIQDNLDAQRDIVNLEGKLAEARAKTDSERLEARIKTQAEIDKINVESAKADISATDKKISEQVRELTFGASYVEGLMKQTKDLQDFNLESRLNEEEKAYASLIRQRDLGFITQQQYTDGVIEIYKRYFDTQDEQRQKDFQEQIKNYDALKIQRNKLNNDLKTANETQTTNEKIAEEERRKQREEEFKKYKENLQKRKDALADYNKDVQKLEQDRLERERDLNRQLEDFVLDRISLVRDEDGIYREDLIAGYDETAAKLKASRDRSLEDEKRSFEESLKSFQETEKKKLDNNGKRIISDETINAEIDKRRKLFEDEQVKRAETFNQQIVLVEQDKANQIKEINDVLNNELVFGDNNMADSKKQIALDLISFQVQQKQRELELERSTMFDKIVMFGQESDVRKKSQVDLLKEIQALQKQQREAERQAQLQALAIQKAEDLKNIQGDETQKGEQKKRILEYYKKEEEKINENSRLKEKEAERKNLEDIWAQRNSNLQKWTDFGAQVANTILGLFSAVNELNRVNMENELMMLRDMTAQQTSDLNEQYNQQRADLDAKLQAGIISQQQYNDAIKELDGNLATSTKALQDKQKAEELKAKKKAFEDDKKLKIAQAIIAGIQGAVSAFTGAFQLGPIAGPIVGGVLAALVASTTAVQVAAIAKTKFDGGAPAITPPNTSGSTGAADGGGGLINQASSGGFTGFSPTLTGPNFGTPTNPNSPGVTTNGMRVYVVESDITDSQNRVRTLESNATFG